MLNFLKLNQIKDEYEILNQEISVPEVINDSKRYAECCKKLGKIQIIAEKYLNYQKLECERQELEKNKLDPELSQLAIECLQELETQITAIYSELETLLNHRSTADDKDVIVEIRGGAGGEEAFLFAGELARMYMMWAEKNGFTIEDYEASETELGGIKTCSFKVCGKGAYGWLKYECGVHRVQRVPVTESNGRIQTSTATVAVLPEFEDVDVDLNEKDIRIDLCHSSGAGGQNVNKVQSAIRLTHIPTGIVVMSQEERSQLMNKEKAYLMLKAKLYELYSQKAQEEYAQTRKDQVGTGDRSERIRTYNFPQGRVTDHRINKSIFSIESFMNGDISDMLQSLNEANN